MEITINAVHFETSERLGSFIDKKVNRLSKFYDGITLADVTLKVVKPETNNNKDASIKIFVPGAELFAQEVCDTFEEAVDKCVAALERQLVKHKEKLSHK